MPSTSETTLRNRNSGDLFSGLEDVRHIEKPCGAHVAHVAQINCATQPETPIGSGGGASATAPHALVAHVWRRPANSLVPGGFVSDGKKFKKSVSQEVAELDEVIAELTGNIRALEAVVRPRLDQIRQAEEAIGQTVAGGLRLSDRTARRPHFDRILEIRATYGARFEEVKDLKRRVKSAIKHRNHLASLKEASNGKA